MKARALSFAVCLFAFTSGASAETSFEALKAAFDKTRTDLGTELLEIDIKAREHYLKGLRLAKQGAQKGEDLQAVVAIEAEEKRFGGGEPLLEDPPREVIEPIAEARAKILAWRLEESTAVKKKILAANEKYVSLLESMKLRLTRAGKTEAALKVDAALKSAAARIEKLRDELPNRTPLGQVNGDLPSDLRRGLVLYLPFDQASGGKTGDLSESKHEAKLEEGARWSREGKLGGAIAFKDGASVEIPHHEEFVCGHDQSFACWIQLDKSPGELTGFPTLFVKSDWEAKKGYHIRFVPNEEGMLQHHTVHGSWFTRVGWPQSRSLEPERWYHLAVTVKGWEIRIYADGEPVAEGKISQDAVPCDKPLGIGNNFPGKLDEVLIYDRALAKSEVKRIYRHQHRREE